MPAPIRYLLAVGFLAVLITGCSALMVVVLAVPTERLFWTVCQPPEADFYTQEYCLSVIEETTLQQQISTESTFYLQISTSQQPDDELVRKQYSFSVTDGQVESYIQSSGVTWEENGITFVEADGHQVFFPLEQFSTR